MVPFPPEDPATRLSGAVGGQAVPVEPLAAEDSLFLAASEMAHQGFGVVAVESQGAFVGVVTEQSLAAALASGAEGSAELGPYVAAWPSVASTASGAEALRCLRDTGAPALVVLDSNGAVVGMVSASRLYAPEAAGAPRKALIGGMATPFGVYLTNGAVGAGAAGWPLVATGALLFALLAASSYIATALFFALPEHVRAQPWVASTTGVCSTVVFLVLLRSLPLAGTHGAEHKVVHAIERGEPLTPLVVSRMPRVHPRCGTNLAVGAMVFVFVAGIKWTPYEEIRFLLALVVTLALYRPLGALFQAFVTTKPPTMAQLENGIAAGEELLQQMQTSPRSAGIVRRLLSSGLFHIVAGSAAMELVLYFAEGLLRVPAAWRVFS